MRFYPTEKIYRYYILVVSVWVVCIVTRLKYNGLVYGFDYALYQPDGMYYSQQTLELLGTSKTMAMVEVVSWYKDNASRFASLDLSSFYNTSSNPWLVTKFRVLYPLTSVPFVYLFGLTGMLVIPALSLLLFFLVIIKIAFLEKTPRVGVVIVLGLATSTTLLRWTTVNYSDALLLALFSIFTYLLYRAKGHWSKRNLVILTIIIFAATFTKQTLPIWLCIGFYFMHLRQVRVALVVLFSSLFFATPSFLSFPFSQYFNSKAAGGIPASLIDFIYKSVKVNMVELGQLIVLDRSLLLVLMIVFYCAIKSPAQQNTLLLIWTMIGCLIVNSLVGVPGVNFRYLLPILPPAILLLLTTNVMLNLENSFSKFKFKSQV
jgi:hypothetical protein